MATRGRKPRVKWTSEVERKFIDIWADILEELDKKVPLQEPMPPTQAALLACKECNTVRSIQPHARGDRKLKQQKKEDPEHYVRPFSFVTNYYY